MVGQNIWIKIEFDFVMSIIDLYQPLVSIKLHEFSSVEKNRLTFVCWPSLTLPACESSPSPSTESKKEVCCHVLASYQ